MRISQSLTILGSILILTIGGVWIAHAATPSADGTFTACINKTSGAVRIIDAERVPAVKCAANEIRRTWSQGAPSTYLVESDFDTAIREDDGTWVTSALCDPGDERGGVFNWGFHNGPASRVGIEGDVVTGREGQTLRLDELDGPTADIIGYVVITCLDTAAPAHTP